LISTLDFALLNYLSTDTSNLPTSLSTVNHRYYTVNLTAINTAHAAG